ncbi:MAG TPA: xanthine dehydrogenase family protein molybdopterin-binding subunit, partial [Acidimicrobiia bacterium]|nr:xanthine dehydrogenase family protein molybdopterin-binding subunit [Acidimicrobiia bacterium]
MSPPRRSPWWSSPPTPRRSRGAGPTREARTPSSPSPSSPTTSGAQSCRCWSEIGGRYNLPPVTTEQTIPSFIGAPVQRREDPALITGTARYVDDITLAGTLHLALVRSPFAHAEIAGIDVEDAREMPGVWAIITPEDVADVSMPPTPNPKRSVPRRFPLVQGRALMVGDPVVAVVAESPVAARDAADMVFVDYEPLAVVGDVETAIEAPPIHPDFESNVAYDRSKGDRQAFEALEGEIRLSGVVEHPRVVPAPMETRAIMAEWRSDGLTVHLSSQAPQLMAEQLADDFDLPQTAVRVVTPFV